MPVDGPARIASTITSGVSVTPETPNSSTLSESPGPLVPIMLTAPAALGQDALHRRAPAAGRLQVEVHQLGSLAPEALFQEPPEPLLVAVELEEAEERSGHDDVLDHFFLEIAQRDLAGRNREDAHAARLELLDGDRPRGTVVEQYAPVDEVPAVTEDGVPVWRLGHIRVDVVVEAHQNVDGLFPPGAGRAIGDHQRVVLVGAVDRRGEPALQPHHVEPGAGEDPAEEIGNRRHAVPELHPADEQLHPVHFHMRVLPPGSRGAATCRDRKRHFAPERRGSSLPVKLYYHFSPGSST